MPDQTSTQYTPAKELGATAQQLRAMFSQSAVGIAIARGAPGHGGGGSGLARGRTRSGAR